MRWFILSWLLRGCGWSPRSSFRIWRPKWSVSIQMRTHNRREGPCVANLKLLETLPRVGDLQSLIFDQLYCTMFLELAAVVFESVQSVPRVHAIVTFLRLLHPGAASRKWGFKSRMTSWHAWKIRINQANRWNVFEDWPAQCSQCATRRSRNNSEC